MTIRKLPLAALATICATIAMLALASASAWAASGHFLESSFAVPGATDVAVDDSSGAIYVIDGNAVRKFNAAGEPAEFSATHTDTVDEGARFGELGESQVAVDNSTGSNHGDIYVVEGQETVQIFASDGTALGVLDRGSGAPEFGQVCGVAVASDGTVYVGTFEGASYIDKFIPSGAPVKDSDYKSSVGETHGGWNIAVDSVGSAYVTYPYRYFGFGIVPKKYDALQFGSIAPLSTSAGTSPASGLAVDESTNHLYIDEASQIVEYDSAGNTVGEPFGAGTIGLSPDLAVNNSTGRLYVADVTNGVVDVYTPAVTLPDITTGAPSNVLETSVTVNGTVNPLGIDATCQIEYGTSVAYGATAPCVPQDVGSGSSALPVSAAVNGLTPDTVYHYRITATNAGGSDHGLDRTFATGSPPVVDGESTLSVGASTAALKAEVNPSNFPTSYHFEYGTDTSYGSSAPVPDSKLAAAGSDQNAAWTLSGLRPGTHYHYRAVATNAFGTAYGADQTFTTFAVVAGGGSCPNGQIRASQQSTYLPDCRAFELVSPASKGAANIASDPSRDQSSTSGDAVKYWSTVAFGETLGSEVPGAEYVSQRGPDGWSSQSINPQQDSPLEPGETPMYAYMSPDLSKGIFYANSPVGSGHPNVAAIPNLYLRSDVLAPGPGSYELLSDSLTLQPYIEPSPISTLIRLTGASSDFRHVTFQSVYDLTAQTSGLSTLLPKLYEWDNGTVRLVGILPNGEPAPASVAGAGAGGGHNYAFNSEYLTTAATSADGSRVVFTASPLVEAGFGSPLGSANRAIGNLYMRINGSETIQLNASERPQPDPNGNLTAEFWTATPDDSQVFFTTAQALTDDAVVSGTKESLYRYDLNAPAGHHLTLISVDREPSDDNGGSNTSFAHIVVGASEDGSYVYFLSGDELLPGMAAISHEELYVWHDGVIRTIARHGFLVPGLGGADLYGWRGVGIDDGETWNGFSITPGGRTIAFVSSETSTAESAGVLGAGLSSGCTSEACPQEVYTYNYDSQRVTCVSCKPAGDALGGAASFSIEADTGALAHRTQYLNHPLTGDGRYVFFDSTDTLLPQATNGRWNVYEYDTVTNELHLLSSGSCDCDSHFVDASPDGRNVFFTTRERLVRADFDNNADLYDARIEGGLPSQQQAPAVPCAGDDCQNPASSAPGFSAPSSSTFSGQGNPPPVLAAKAVKAKAKPLSRSQKLARALKQCRQKAKRKLAACERLARRKYAAKQSRKAAKQSGGHSSRRAGR